MVDRLKSTITEHTLAFFNKNPETVRSDGEIVAGTYRAPRALTASAVKINLKDQREEEKLKKRLDNAKWQREAWDYYDYIGEIKYAANLVSNVMSRINLYVAYVEDSSRIPTPIRSVEGMEDTAETAEAVFDLLETGDGGTSGLLRDAALSMFIAGECYLVKEPAQFLKGIPEKWNIRSIDEIVVEHKGKNRGTFVKSTRNEDRLDWVPLPDSGFISRMWRKHPRYSGEADSSMRGILEDCDDLLIFSREGRHNSRSRVNAGILYIPDELEDSSVSDSDADEESDGSDDNHQSLLDELSEALVGPAMSDDHANALVPWLLRGPADMADKIKHIPISRPIDPMYEQMIEFKLERILQALDIPKDIAKGLSAVKYSNGIIIEESLYKSHIEPLMLLVADQLTNGFLRPALIAQGIPEEVVSKMVIWYDPSAITAKPSKAEAANFGVEQNIVSGTAWRAANGFSEADAPSQQEIAEKMLTAKLVLDPMMASKMLNSVLPEIVQDVRGQALDSSNPGDANALNEALGEGGEAADPTAGLIGGQETSNGAIVDGDLAPNPADAPPGLMEP